MKAVNVCQMIVGSMLLAACAGRSPQFDVLPTTQGFKQEIRYNNKMDILWVVDDSDSMAASRAAISQQFGKFIDAFSQKQLDFRIAVTTTDMRIGKGAEGAFVGKSPVILGSHSQAKAMFSETMTSVGSNGAQEQGLLAMRTALSPELLGTLNSGFLREDSTLVIIFLTNENDHSVPGQMQGYVDFLNRLKPTMKYGARGWVVNFIGTLDLSTSCAASGKAPEIGSRYLDLVKLSGGQGESLCADDLTQVVARLQKRVEDMITEYHLDRPPQIDTITVRINGSWIQQNEVNGWTYEDEGYIVRFHGDAIPSADSLVEIEFKQRASK